MHSIERNKSWSSSAGIARLAAGRLPQPGRLRSLVPTDTWSRYLQRLLWLFGGR